MPETIRQYEQLARQYDEIAEELEYQKREKLEREQQLEAAQDAVLEHIDRWIAALFAKRSESGEWHPDQQVLKEVEEKRLPVDCGCGADSGAAAVRL